jgi:UDP-N-acetylglucosamine 3-dehydrogenase
VKRLNVAIISAGGAGRAHIARFSRNPKSCVRAVFDPKEKNLRDFLWIKEKGGYVTNDIAKILNDESVDIISICSPDYTHFDFALAAVKAGKHVLVEKPLVTSLEQCEQLRAPISNSDKVFGVHHQMRCVPCFVEARKSVISGEIGLPYILEADYIHNMRERATLYDNWRMDARNYQKIAFGMFSHTIDLLRWIVDDEVVEVFSYATHIGWPDYPGKDTVMTILKFSRGAIGKVLSTIACQRPQLNSLVIYGTEGSIVNNLLNGKSGLKRFIHIPKNRSIKKRIFSRMLTRLLIRVKSTQNYPFSIYEHDAACQRLIEEFLTCVQEGEDFPINFSEGAYTTQICLASIESYEKGKPARVKRTF